MRRIFFAFLTFGIAICQDFSSFQPEIFYKDAKKIFFCQFCEKFENGDESGARKSLNLLADLNEFFGKNPFDGIPTDLRPIPPLAPAPWAPRSKIGAIFNNRENVLRPVALRTALGPLNGQNRARKNQKAAENFCLSFNCDNTEFDY